LPRVALFCIAGYHLSHFEVQHKDQKRSYVYFSFLTLLPAKNDLLWLSFIYTLTVFIHEASNSAKIDVSYRNQTLTITSDKPLYLTKEKIKTLEKPIAFAIIINDEEKLPKNSELGIV